MEDFSEWMQENGILKNKGMYVIHHYYQAKANYPNPVFIVKNLTDLVVILAIAPKDQIYGIIVNNDNSAHKTPIVAWGSQFIIFDSLGVSGTLYAKPLAASLNTHCERLGIKAASIVNVDFQRQSDFISCGTESFMVMKQALNLGKQLFDIYKQESAKFVPPEIAKYTQGIARLWPVCKKGNTTNLSLTIKHLKHYVIKSSHKIETVEAYIRRHQEPNGKFNLVVDQRRNKHKTLILKFLQSNHQNQLVDIAMEASGINFLLNNHQALTRLFKGKEDEILDLIGVRNCLSGPQGEIVFIDFSAFKDEKLTRALIQRLEEKLCNVLDKFLVGNEETTLYQVASVLYAKLWLATKYSPTQFKPEVSLHSFFKKADQDTSALANTDLTNSTSPYCTKAGIRLHNLIE